VSLSPSLTQKNDGIPLRDIPCFHFRDEVRKHVLTSDTYSTMSHSKAMPLQIGIEEGSRLTAVCVGGLQYCRYNQNKISLIILLSDFVWVCFQRLNYPFDICW